MTAFDTTTIKNAWQEQSALNGTVSLADARAKAHAFQQSIRKRNTIEYTASVIVIGLFGLRLFYQWGNLLAVSSCALIIAGTLFMVFHLVRRGHATLPPVDCDLRTYLHHLVDDVSRQRDLLRGIFWWYLAPFLPGMALFTIEGALHAQTLNGVKIAGLSLSLVFVAVVIVGLYFLNQRAADTMQAGIDLAESALAELEASHDVDDSSTT